MHEHYSVANQGPLGESLFGGAPELEFIWCFVHTLGLGCMLNGPYGATPVIVFTCAWAAIRNRAGGEDPSLYSAGCDGTSSSSFSRDITYGARGVRYTSDFSTFTKGPVGIPG